MQTESSSKSQPDVVKTKKQLNANAAIFEPKNQKLNSTSSDPIWSKFSIPGNIKSTMLVPPPRQYSSPASSLNYSTYVYTSPNQYHSIKLDYEGHSNGSSYFYPMQPVCIDQNILTPHPQIVPEFHTINNIRTPTSPLSVDQKDILNSSQTSKDHSNIDCPPQTQPVTQSIGIGVNQPLLIPQNNLSTFMWPRSSQSQPVALFPSYYPGSNNIYLVRSPQLYTTVNPYMVSQNKSVTNSHIRNRVFNTGDPELDVLLNELVKRINPVNEFVFRSNNSRFFVIKSFNEDNIYQSIRHGVWCSTPGGNETLVAAYNQVKFREVPNDELTEPHVYLFFSVNGSGFFCGVAEMTSGLHADNSSNIWNQKKWQNQFSVNWLYIKDVPNNCLRQIKLESNDNRPVTNCRDATEILPMEKGIEVLKIIHNIYYDTCLLNDFHHEITKVDKS